MARKFNRFLIKFNRYIAYTLIANVVILFVTGYRIKGYFNFFSIYFANITHRIQFNISFIVLLALHMLISIRFILMRKQIKGKYIDIILILTGITFIAFFSFFALI